MTRNQRGFTLVELMVTMLIFVIAIAAAANILTGLLGQFKQQSKIAESNVEGLVGFEMLRADLEMAGSGLPWVMGDAAMGFAAYNEAVNDGATNWDDTLYNDASPNAPRAIVTGRPAGGFQIGANEISDVLAIKAASISLNAAVRKWTYIANTGGPNVFRTWGNADEDLADNDRVIVINPERGPNAGILMNNGGVFFTQVKSLPSKGLGGVATTFEPTTMSYSTFLVYGISDNVDPRMPFNRADFYVKQPADLPDRCEPSTGVLYKGVINNSTAAGGGEHTELPLFDCVGYMKVVLALDMNDDGTAGTFANADATVVTGGEGATTATVQATLADPALLRQRLKQLRVYIVAQEGQIDTGYQSPATIAIPDADMNVPPAILIPDFTIPNRNYRWKVYSIVTTPTSLR